jgi:hypothetical protein
LAISLVGSLESSGSVILYYRDSSVVIALREDHVPESESTRRLSSALETGGLLLLQDKSFPCVVRIVTGESLGSSWWSHPRSDEVFRAVSSIAAAPDVLVCKLLGGKVTFVHRSLWPAVLAVATAGEPWQTAGLSREAQSLWEEVEQHGSITTSGKGAKDVETRLLAHGEQLHTESGNHKIRLETWTAWARRARCENTLSADQGRFELERAVSKLGGAVKSLPWHQFHRRTRS